MAESSKLFYGGREEASGMPAEGLKKHACVYDKENSIESIEIQELYNHIATIFVPSGVVDSYTASHNILYGS